MMALRLRLGLQLPMRRAIREAIEASRSRINISGANAGSRTRIGVNLPDPKSGISLNPSHQEPKTLGVGLPMGAAIALDSAGDGYVCSYNEFIGPHEWTPGRLLDSVRSSQGSSLEDWAYCSSLLARHVFERRALVSVVRLPAPPFTTQAEQAEAWSQWREVRHTGRESHEHRFLKLLAARWLWAQGATDVEYERSYWSGIADVVSEQLQVAVECGNTKANRLEAIFRSECAVLVVPFTGLPDEAGATGYLFQSTVAGREYGAVCQFIELERQREQMEAFSAGMKARA